MTLEHAVKFYAEPDEVNPARWQVIAEVAGQPGRCIAASVTALQAQAAMKVASRTAFALGVPVTA
jgi:cytochrome P450